MGRLAMAVFSLCTFAALTIVRTQGHVHSVESEAPYYKYTREANEEAARQMKPHSGEHFLDDGDHKHDHHGHSHDKDPNVHHEPNHDEATTHLQSDYGHLHNHIHDSEGDHGHSHDDHTHKEEFLYNSDANEPHNKGKKPHRTKVDSEKTANKAQKLWLKTPYDPNGPLAFLNNIRTRLWVYSIGSTLLISIAPFVILSVIPIQSNSADSASLLKVLLAFGSGGLLGDAFLHLIPHAQPADNEEIHSHSHTHSHGSDDGHAHSPHDMEVGTFVLAGIIAFLTVEKVVRIFRGEEGHSHSHSHSAPQNEEGSDEKREEKTEAKNEDNENANCNFSSAEGDVVSGGCTKEDNEKTELISNSHTSIKVAAYLNMAADFAHNVTDGLAIGASYLAGTTIGVVTMITVLVHEVPHEIGDFAILVQSGFSKKRAMFVQLLTALGAITGCAISLWTADIYGDLADSASTAPVLSFTAGGFIYIALVSVIPELLENTSLWQSVKESVAMMLGIYLMYLIGFYE